MTEPARQLKAVREANRDMHAVAQQALEWVKVSEERVAAAEGNADRVRAELKERAMKTLREMSAQARKQIEAAKEAQAAAESKLGAACTWKSHAVQSGMGTACESSALASPRIVAVTSVRACAIDHSGPCENVSS